GEAGSDDGGWRPTQLEQLLHRLEPTRLRKHGLDDHAGLEPQYPRFDARAESRTAPACGVCVARPSHVTNPRMSQIDQPIYRQSDPELVVDRHAHPEVGAAAVGMYDRQG